jgi:hypothetical protein
MGVNCDMKKVLLRGPVLSHSGYGEHARFILRSLQRYPEYFDIYIINLNWGQTSWIDQVDEERELIDSIIQKTIQYTQEGGHKNFTRVSKRDL